MSETVRYEGKIRLRPRLENETDKDYFERVTGKNWQRYSYEPNSISESILDNDVSYYEVARGRGKGYIYLNKNIYEFIECVEKDTEWDYCNITDLGNDTYKFDTMFYNGGAGLDEMLEYGFNKGEIHNDKTI